MVVILSAAFSGLVAGSLGGAVGSLIANTVNRACYRESLVQASGARPSTDAISDLYDRFKRERRLGECVEGCAGGGVCGLCLATTSCVAYQQVAGPASVCVDTAAVCCCIHCSPTAADTIDFQLWMQRNPDLVVRAGLIAAEEELSQMVVADIITQLTPPPHQEPFTQEYPMPQKA